MALRPIDTDSDYCLQGNINLGKLAKSASVPANVIVDGFQVYNSNAAARFVCVLEGGSLPPDGTVPLFTLDAAAQSPVGMSFTPNGRFCENGLTLALSTTDTTLTAAAADGLFDIQVRWPED